MKRVVLTRLAEYLEALAARLMNRAIGVPVHTRRCGQTDCACYLDGEEDGRTSWTPQYW